MGKKDGKPIKIRQSWDNLAFDIVINVVLVFLLIIVAYPVFFVVVASFSDPTFVNSGKLLLYPKGFNVLGYRRVLEDKSVWIGYGNTILYTVCGTALGTMSTVMAGYALSRKDLVGRGLVMKLIVFTMYFGGGTIPFFLVVKSLGLLNTRLILIILGSISVYNTIMVRSFMISTIPEDLLDAATIDGCGNGTFFFRVVLPLSKAIIAVMVLYIAVGYWNSYFNAMILVTDMDKQPLQLFLRRLLLMSSSIGASDSSNIDPQQWNELQTMVQNIKYSLIVVSTVPILCVYPFVQRYFVQGVMIGSVKG